MTPVLKHSVPIKGLDDKTVGDFWAWAYSDVLTNTNRSVLAEYIVAVALDLDHTPKEEWNSYDLTYRGSGIEVKSSAFVQNWHQKKPSRPTFDIAKRKWSWDATTGIWTQAYRRPAKVYVFSLCAERDRDKIDVLDVKEWVFHVLPTALIDMHFRDQKTVALSRIQGISKPTNFSSLQEAVNHAIERIDRVR